MATSITKPNPEHLMTWRLAPFTLATFALSACSSIHASGQRVGKLYPSQAEGCEVRFENLDFMEASANFEQVGMVTLSGTSDQPQAWEGETKEKLWPEVCKLGGNIVTPNAMAGGQSTMGMGTGMIQFSVWRERAPSERPATSGEEQL